MMSYPHYVPNIGSDLAEAIDAELARARSKFPQSKMLFSALIEEVGEMGKARCEGDHDGFRAEAVQVAVMAIRCIQEGPGE